MPFTKLRGVTPDQLDEVVSTFTDEDWDALEQGYLIPAGHDVLDHLDPLGADEDFDTTVLFCRLYSHLTARNPEV